MLVYFELRSFSGPQRVLKGTHEHVEKGTVASRFERNKALQNMTSGPTNSVFRNGTSYFCNKSICTSFQSFTALLLRKRLEPISNMP